MSETTTAEEPIRCTRCGDEDGPFAGTPDKPICEGCHERNAA